MLDIKILGTGCADCLRMREVVLDGLQNLGVGDAHVELVDDQRLMDYGLLGGLAPGLLINARLAWAGSKPTLDQVRGWLLQALKPLPA